MRNPSPFARFLGSAAIAALLAVGLAGCQTARSPEVTGSLNTRAEAAPGQASPDAMQALGERYRANPRDIEAALQALREREFKAGRYDPAMQMADPPSYMFQMRFPPNESWPAPGAQHASIEEAIDASAESGTGSILDLLRLGSAPEFFTVCPLSRDELVELFGTTKPTRDLLESTLINPKPGDKAVATTPESDAMSKALKKRGFTFVGSTICYAFMQAVGMVDDHVVDCFRHAREPRRRQARR